MKIDHETGRPYEWANRSGNQCVPGNPARCLEHDDDVLCVTCGTGFCSDCGWPLDNPEHRYRCYPTEPEPYDDVEAA